MLIHIMYNIKTLFVMKIWQINDKIVLIKTTWYLSHGLDLDSFNENKIQTTPLK